MALVKYGGGVIQMSGSVAGNTYARNRYGNYVRARTKPVNPNTDIQAEVRSIIAYLTEYWYDTVTAIQRTAWNDYAAAVVMKNKLGEAIKLSGFNHFIRSNSVRMYNKTPIVAAGPTDNTLPEKDPEMVVDVDSSPQQVIYTFNDSMSWNQEEYGQLYIQQGRPQNGTRNFFAGPWRNNGHFDGMGGGGVTSPITGGLIFPVATGQKVWYRFRIARADGRLSEPWIVSALVHAAAPNEVPNVIGMTQADATAAIIAAGLVLGTVTEANHDTIPVGCVISTDPIAGTILTPGAAVNIVISLGPAV